MITSLHLSLLLGINVITDRCTPKKQPKFSLKSGSYVSEECRRDFNDFLIQNFGYELCVLMTNGSIYIHPDNIKYLYKLLIKNSNDTGRSADSADLIPWKDFRYNYSPFSPIITHLTKWSGA